MARHPGASFPVNHLQEAVPKSTSDRFPPPCHENRGLAGGTIFSMFTNQKYAMMFYMFYIYY